MASYVDDSIESYDYKDIQRVIENNCMHTISGIRDYLNELSEDLSNLQCAAHGIGNGKNGKGLQCRYYKMECLIEEAWSILQNYSEVINTISKKSAVFHNQLNESEGESNESGSVSYITIDKNNKILRRTSTFKTSTGKGADFSKFEIKFKSADNYRVLVTADIESIEKTQTTLESDINKLASFFNKSKLKSKLTSIGQSYSDFYAKFKKVYNNFEKDLNKKITNLVKTKNLSEDKLKNCLTFLNNMEKTSKNLGATGIVAGYTATTSTKNLISADKAKNIQEQMDKQVENPTPTPTPTPTPSQTSPQTPSKESKDKVTDFSKEEIDANAKKYQEQYSNPQGPKETDYWNPRDGWVNSKTTGSEKTGDMAGLHVSKEYAQSKNDEYFYKYASPSALQERGDLVHANSGDQSLLFTDNSTGEQYRKAL